MKITAIVKNIPDNMAKYLARNNGVVWITVTPYSDELWYYGLWYTEKDARMQAQEEDKIVLRVEE